MAQEASEAPVAGSSSSSPNNSMWETHQMHAPFSSFPSWSPYAGTLLAAGSALGADSSSSSDMRLPSEHVHGHVWNQLGVISTDAHGSSEHGSYVYRENFLSLLASKNVPSEMFDDVPNYLKVMDRGIDNMAGTADYSLHGADRYAGGSVSPIKYEFTSSPLYLGNSLVQGSMSCLPCYDHEVKERNQQQKFGAPMAPFLQQMIPTNIGIQSTVDCSGIGTDRICQQGRVTEAPFGMRNLPDFGSFSGYRSTAELMSTNRQELEIVPARASSSGSGTAGDTKKRKSEEMLEGNAKKSKQEASNASLPTLQAPKVKLGEKITALQQIVSPFGKTDTASVLFETIKYIKFLHEQILLFSEPYMATSANKVQIPRRDDEATEKAVVEHQQNLRGRGLCLVPVSWTPQVYRDNSVTDCWTPAYRSCMYR